MENNVELIKSLFVDIDPSIINNDKLDIKDIPKETIMYLKKLLKYTSGVKAFKTYHSIEKIYKKKTYRFDTDINRDFIFIIFINVYITK